ncbi:MAG: Alkaline phosphatase synthesis transcriptional regulatory protein PhoP [Parcubacteria group bacterium ADurb.Bin247]|jgi:DNA-binding response OmpR family regulator|nr:MAG: Alkaline phosphatase synthesis transcriptional regulatory protein PhoP [Parcubacteria group bacterium ADurb.Bin247]HQB85318.1 response regulator [Candidatus Pacearchaeota archaeon]
MSKKILIIDDDEILVDLLRNKLEESGFAVFIAHNGVEGLKAIKKENPDIILLDIVMPEMGGFEVMEELQKEGIQIPIIIVSNSGQPVEIDLAQKLGAKDWLIKTDFDPKEVLEKVIKQINK